MKEEEKEISVQLQVINKKIENLREEIVLIEKYIKPLAILGIKSSMVANSFISAYPKTLEQVSQIIELYKPIKNASLEFAGSPSIQTLSPFLLSINNYTHCIADSLHIRYSSEVEIRIEVPFSILSTSVIKTFKTNPSYIGKYPERNGAIEVSLKGISEQKYYSGDFLNNFTYYAKITEDIIAINYLLNLEPVLGRTNE